MAKEIEAINQMGDIRWDWITEPEEGILLCLSSFLLRLGVGGPGVARDDADAAAVDLVRQLHHAPQHDAGKEGAAGDNSHEIKSVV